MNSISAINAGDTAWVLVSTALVMMMTPAFVFFYGGMVRKKMSFPPALCTAVGYVRLRSG